MAELQIPSSRKATLAKVAKMPEEELDALVRSLNELKLPTDKQTSLECVKEAVKTVNATDVGETLYELYRIRETAGVSKKRFVDDLHEALRKSKNFEGIEAAVLRGRLTRLLDVKSLDVLSKAYAVQREQPYLYCEGRILSDIRPVFSDDVKKKPIGVVLSHTLKIVYHQDNEHREFFVALDRADLNELKDIVDRAQEKNSSIETLMKATGLPILGT